MKPLSEPIMTQFTDVMVKLGLDELSEIKIYIHVNVYICGIHHINLPICHNMFDANSLFTMPVLVGALDNPMITCVNKIKHHRSASSVDIIHAKYSSLKSQHLKGLSLQRSMIQ